MSEAQSENEKPPSSSSFEDDEELEELEELEEMEEEEYEDQKEDMLEDESNSVCIITGY